MVHNFHRVFAIVILCSVTFCAPAPSLLLGKYAIEEQGRLVEFIRIERNGDGYALVEKQAGKWLQPVEVEPVSKPKFEEILKHPIDAEFTGLSNKMIGIFKVPKGWKTETFVCSTGYWLATVLGPVELHKL